MIDIITFFYRFDYTSLFCVSTCFSCLTIQDAVKICINVFNRISFYSLCLTFTYFYIGLGILYDKCEERKVMTDVKNKYKPLIQIHLH